MPGSGVVESIKTEDGKIMESIKPICESLGVDHDSQRVKLNECGWSRTVMITVRETQGIKQE